LGWRGTTKGALLDDKWEPEGRKVRDDAASGNMDGQAGLS